MKNSCIAISSFIVRWSALAALFIVPLFFLPLTLYPADLNKQALFSAFIFIGGIAWLARALMLGKLEYAKTRVGTALAALVVFVAVSAWFSSARVPSFMGITGGEADTALAILSFALLYFLFSSESHDSGGLRRALLTLMGSGTIVALLALSRLIGFPAMPWAFAQASTFNAIGTTNGLSLYFGFMAIMAFAGAYYRIAWNAGVRAWCGVMTAVFFALAFLMGYWPLYAGIIVSMLLLVWLDIRSRAIKAPKRHLVPIGVIAVTAFLCIASFGFVSVPLPRVNAPAEIAPSILASFGIAKETAREGARNILFGSGPATYQYQYGKHRDASLNNSSFWGIRFAQGFNAVLSHLVSWGAIGTIIFLVAIFMFAREAVGFMRIPKGQEPMHAAFAAGGAYLALMPFFYPQNFTVYALLFAFMGIMSSLHSHARNMRAAVSLSGAPYRSFAWSLGAVLGIVALGVFSYANAARYRAAVIFERGVRTAQDSTDADRALAIMARGSDMDPKNSSYLQIIASAFLARANALAGEAKEPLSDEVRARIGALVADAVGAAERSVQANPADSAHWLGLARVYEAVVPLDPAASQGAFAAYAGAMNLEPNNPAIPAAAGAAHAAYAIRLSDTKRAEEYQAAIALLAHSIELKPDYANALYLLGLVYGHAGNVPQALENLQAAQRLDPENKAVAQAIDELKNSRSAEE